MKKLLALVFALGTLTVFSGFSVGQDAPKKDKRPRPPIIWDGKPVPRGDWKLGGLAQSGVIQEAAAKTLVAEAIASSVVMRKGVEFPVVAKGTGSDPTTTGWASCEPGDTQTFSENAAIDLESPKHAKKTNTYPSEPPERKIVAPPNGDWIIQSYKRVITSAGAPYEAGDSAFPAGYSFLTAGNYSSVKSTMQNYVGSLNVSPKIKADLNAKLDTLISNISSYSYSVSTSHGTVEHTALVRGTGRTNTQEGHSWYHGYINGTLVCSPAYLRDQNVLTTRLKTWVNSVVGKLPDTLNNGWAY